eukprot:gene9335-17038_t
MLNCPGSDCWKILFPKNFKEDAKSILKFSWPILFSSVSEMLVPIVPLIFVGQLGETELAAAGLGISYCNLVGFAQLFGLDTATQTLSAQSFGAGNLFRYGVISQRAVILQLTWALIILPLWINSEKILLKLGQEKDVARIAGLFINTRIPSLLLQGIYRTMKTYLYCQEVSAPLVVIGFICLGFSVVANYLFVSYLKMGVVGSAIAIDLTYLLLCLLLFGYIRKKKISQTWPGWSGECLLQWGQFVKLALPGALMIFFDWGSAETGVFLMVILSVFDALLLISLKDYIGYAFSKSNIIDHFVIFVPIVLFWILNDGFKRWDFNSRNVIKMISSVCPIIAAYHILDGSQGIASGILRGIGLQRFGAVINFIGFMVVGLPLGAVLALVVHLNVVGFWCGMAVGIALQARKHAEVPGLEFSDESTSKEGLDKTEHDAQLIPSDSLNYGSINDSEQQESSFYHFKAEHWSIVITTTTTTFTLPLQYSSQLLRGARFVSSILSEMLVPIVTLIFVGHLGETQLAAAGLGMSYCNLVGFAQLVGLDTATQTLSAQSFGAGNLFRYGVILQRAVILQLTWALIILPLWINSEKILLKLGQEKDVARIAGLFINTRIPSLLLQGIYSTMKTYLLCQEISTPLVVNGFIGLVFSVVANYLFVSYLDMGLVGSAIVIDLTYLVLCLLLLCYIWKKRILQAWPGWSGECLLQWGQFVKLALPGALMVIFDWGSAETGVFLMGLVGKVEVGTQSVVFNLLSTLFMGFDRMVYNYAIYPKFKYSHLANYCSMSSRWISNCIAHVITIK